jgi:hypothetical protein
VSRTEIPVHLKGYLSHYVAEEKKGSWTNESVGTSLSTVVIFVHLHISR